MAVCEDSAARGSGSHHVFIFYMMIMMVSGVPADFGIGFHHWPPSEVIAVPGSQIKLSCATNVTADKISWQYNHHFLLGPPMQSQSDDTHHPDFTVNETEEGSELIINVGDDYEQYKHQLGLYQCVAWFGAIALTSLPGRLEAAVLEEFSGTHAGVSPHHVKKMGVEEGGSARIECGNPTSIPDADLTFFKDGKPLVIEDDTVYHVTPHGDLLVMGVGTWASGLYTCTAHNPILNKTVTAPTRTSLVILPPNSNPKITPPEFITLRSFYTASTGSTVRLLCLARGHPKPQISWSKDGGAISSRGVQADDGSLVIFPVAFEDEGTYLCHASNGVGDENVTDVSLEVIESPTITRHPQSQTVEEGEELNLSCRATGNPKPTVMWVFNGGLVPNDDNVQLKDTGLSIKSVEKKHAGIFQCFAHSPEGIVQSVAIISVVPKTITADPMTGKPDIDYLPNEPELSHGRHSGPRRNGGNGGGRGNKRGNHGKKKKQEDMKTTDINSMTTETSEDYQEENVVPDDNLPKKKGRKGVMVPPSKPKMRKVSNDAVMVTWKSPNATGVPIVFYKVQYKEVKTQRHRGSRWMTVDEDISSYVNSYEVTGLETGRVYRFRIAAVYANNDNKLGPTSRRFLLEKDSTIQRPSYPPIILGMIPQGPTAVKLKWEYEETPQIPIEGFFINYRDSTTARDYTKVTVLDPLAREFVVSNLKANISYNFKMQVFNLAGASKFSGLHKKNVAVLGTTTPPTTTIKPVRALEEITLTSDDNILMSSMALYIILGAVIGLFLLIVIVSSTIYACKNRHTQDFNTSSKYEDTAIHIHKEATAYSLPRYHHNNGRKNGYLSHDGVIVTPLRRDKFQGAMESSFIENNNHNIQRVENCYSSPTSQSPSYSPEFQERNNSDFTPVRSSSDTFENAVAPSNDSATIAR